MLRRIAGTHIVCICSSKSYPQIPSLDSSDILFLVMEESTYPTSVKTSRDCGCNMKVEISMKNLALEAARSEAPKVSW
jgi:hypothetical protein